MANKNQKESLLICVHCGESYIGYRADSLYCGTRCRIKAFRASRQSYKDGVRHGRLEAYTKIKELLAAVHGPSCSCDICSTVKGVRTYNTRPQKQPETMRKAQGAIQA